MLPHPQFELRIWQEADRSDFVALHSDPLVMADQGGPLTPAEADAKFDLYSSAWSVEGISRWAVYVDAEFAGYVGVMRQADRFPALGSHCEIGWRLAPGFWGRGIATAAASISLARAWDTIPEDEVLCYTAPDNARSQAVIARLGLERDRSRDFVLQQGGRSWSGLVWSAQRRSKAERDRVASGEPAR